MKNKIINQIKLLDPFKQAIIILLLSTVISLTCYVLKINKSNSWGILIMPIFLFCFYNPFFSLVYEKRMQYIFKSIFAYIIIWIWIILLGCWINETSFKKVEQLPIILISVTLFYFILVMLSFVFKGIWAFLNQVD